MRSLRARPRLTEVTSRCTSFLGSIRGVPGLQHSGGPFPGLSIAPLSLSFWKIYASIHLNTNHDPKEMRSLLQIPNVEILQVVLEDEVARRFLSHLQYQCRPHTP